jgi:hypothetical protein
VRWKQRPRQPVVGHQCHAACLRFGELCVGGDDANRRVLAGPGRRLLRTRAKDLAGVGQLAARIARPCDDGAT